MDVWIYACLPIVSVSACMNAHKNEHTVGVGTYQYLVRMCSFLILSLSIFFILASEHSLGPHLDTHKGPNTRFIHQGLVKSAHPPLDPFWPLSCQSKSDNTRIRIRHKEQVVFEAAVQKLNEKKKTHKQRRCECC